MCSNYDEWEDAEERAKKIVRLLNGLDTPGQGVVRFVGKGRYRKVN